MNKTLGPKPRLNPALAVGQAPRSPGRFTTPNKVPQFDARAAYASAAHLSSTCAQSPGFKSRATA